MTVLRFGIKQEAVVEGNGNGKRKRRKRIIIWSSIAAGVLALVVTGVVIASSTGTKIDPLELAKVDAEGPDVPLLKRAYVRAQGMAKEGVVSASALDDAQKNYEMSLNKQNVSKAQLQVLQAKIGQAQGQVAQDRANLKQLE